MSLTPPKWSRWHLLAKVYRRTKQKCTACGHTTEGNINPICTYLAWDTSKGKSPEKSSVQTFRELELLRLYAGMYSCTTADAAEYMPELPIVVKDHILEVPVCPCCLPDKTPAGAKAVTHRVPAPRTLAPPPYVIKDLRSLLG